MSAAPIPVARERLVGRAPAVACRLLGALVVSELQGERVAIRVSEVEAYQGSDDPASHAFRGRTARNGVMFGPAGHLYVYFSYGMHWCANVVCGDEGEAAAVLLRAGRVVEGVQAAAARRPAARTEHDLARGPARLARCLALDGAARGLDLTIPASPVRLYDVAARRRSGVVDGPRVGITAGTERPWRFWIDADVTVSRYRAGARAGERARSRAAGLPTGQSDPL